MIPVERPHLIIAAVTHPGKKGKPNEDRYSISAYRLAPDDPTASVLALLADGIGGHHAGEIAADLAVKQIKNFIEQSSAGRPVQTLIRALTHANQVILEQSKKDPAFIGMGTTCVCAWVIGDQLYAASIGDSRLYLHRGHRLTRLTTDHTWIQEALTDGTLKPSEVKGHPNAHIIRRFLGSMNAIFPDIRLRLSSTESDAQAEANQGMRLMPGDRLVLCSDGLTDLVKDDEISEHLRAGSLETSLTNLINLANQRGGHDNITILVLELPHQPGTVQPRYDPQRRDIAPAPKMPHSAASRWMTILVLLAIIMTILLLIYTNMNGGFLPTG